MKKKQRFHFSILLIVLIAVLGALGYYYYSDKSTTPSRITPPKSIMEKSGYVTPSDQEHAGSGNSNTPTMESAQADHDRGSASGPDSNGQTSLKTTDTSNAPGTGTSVSTNDQPENGVITGTIQQPAPSNNPGGTPAFPTQFGHFHPFSVPFDVSNPPKPGDEGFCKAVESEIHELFSYLDKKDYITLDPDTRISDRVNEVTAALSASPPAPAGESLNPTVLFNNIYHIYRVLNINDIKMIKDILRHERSDIELYMQILYRWLTSSDQCPKSVLTRPSEQTLYLYAGFFVNTLGGRAILFRRDPLYRILFTYYCLVIIHEADREKRNAYGIDLVPFINPLRKQVVYYPELIFRDHYLSVLDNIEKYYRINR